MKILTHTIDNILNEQINTEIRFCIASARALGKDIICIKMKKHDKAEKRGELIIKSLKAIKKEGKLDFFADKGDFERTSPAASYLMNKFPGITYLMEEEDFFLLIKV